MYVAMYIGMYVCKYMWVCTNHGKVMGLQIRLRGSACKTDQDYKVRVCKSVCECVCVCVCVCSHTRQHACMLAADTLVTVTNLCLQHTLKMVALT